MSLYGLGFNYDLGSLLPSFRLRIRSRCWLDVYENTGGCFIGDPRKVVFLERRKLEVDESMSSRDVFLCGIALGDRK